MSNGQNLTPEQRRALASGIGDAVAAKLDDVFGGVSAPGAAPSAEAGCTLRYGTLSKFVPQRDFNGHTVIALFAENADDLSLSSDGDVTYRESAGGVIGGDRYPEVGKTYVASVSRDTKGC